MIERQEELEEAERGLVVGCWGVYVCAAAVDAELPGNDVLAILLQQPCGRSGATG